MHFCLDEATNNFINFNKQLINKSQEIERKRKQVLQGALGAQRAI